MNNVKSNVRVNDFPKLRKGVILYSNGKDFHVLVSPYRKSCEKLCLLSPTEFSFLSLCNGKRSLEETATLVSLQLQDAEKIIAKFEDEKYGALGTGETETETNETSKTTKYRRLLYALKGEWVSARKLEGHRHDVSKYHREGIRDALHQFDEVEVTVSHAYSWPHSALGGLTYGQRLADLLMKRGELKGRILEVGGGTGLLSRHLLDRLREKDPKNYSHVSYTLMDVSHVLLEAQRKKLSSHSHLIRFLAGNAEEGFKEGVYDLIIMNEMIADLSVVRLKKAWLKEGYSGEETGVKEAIEIIKEFQIEVGDAPSHFLFNLGAIKVLIDLKKALAPNGKAYVTEYGGPHFYPRRVSLRGHAEHSIHFGHLCKVANKIGLDLKLEKLSDFLGFDSKVEVIQEECLHYLKEHLLTFMGRELPARAYTAEMLQEQLEDFDRFVNLDFRPVGRSESFMDPGRFWMLFLSS